MSYTALITGASAGIGKTFALNLAGRSSHLLLLGRSLQKLESLKSELLASHADLKVDMFAVDLSQEQAMVQIEKVIAALPSIDLLINNAGYGLHESLLDKPLKANLDLLRLQVEASLRLCYAALKKMKNQKSGTVLNIASLAAFLPASGNVMYSSVKAYLLTLSRALNQEMRLFGVRVSAVCPGYVYTSFHDREEYRDFQRDSIPGIFWISSERMVTNVLKVMKRKYLPEMIIPSWKHRFTFILLNVPFMKKIASHYRYKKLQRKHAHTHS